LTLNKEALPSVPITVSVSALVPNAYRPITSHPVRALLSRDIIADVFCRWPAQKQPRPAVPAACRALQPYVQSSSHPDALMMMMMMLLLLFVTVIQQSQEGSSANDRFENFLLEQKIEYLQRLLAQYISLID
jgi:hypothetical protein